MSHTADARPSVNVAAGSASMPASASISRANASVTSTRSGGPPPAGPLRPRRPRGHCRRPGPGGLHVGDQRHRAHAVIPAERHHRLGELPGPSISGRKAPEPILTSRTRAPVPSAIFLHMIELAMRGIADGGGDVAQALQLAVSGAQRLAGGADHGPDVAQLGDHLVVRERGLPSGMASSLSSVPPVWPSPRPESCGTAAPHAATIGTSGSDTLSPTPPVECLSTVGRAPTTGRCAHRSRSSPGSTTPAHQVPCPGAGWPCTAPRPARRRRCHRRSRGRRTTPARRTAGRRRAWCG